MAGTQIHTGGGNFTIIGGSGGYGQLPRDFSLAGDAESSSGSATRLLEREGVCVLSLSELALKLVRLWKMGGILGIESRPNAVDEH